MAGLSAYLLDRERKHWTLLYENRIEGLDFQTPPSVMNHVTFTAALTGATTHPRGTTILNSLNLELPPGRLLTDHATCYPPAEPGTVLEPLYPDRLAEDFLALMMPGHPADYPAQSWAASTATMLLARHGDQRAPADWTPRAVTFLASAAHRWPHLGLDYLFPLLLDDPQLAVDAGSAALTRCPGRCGTSSQPARRDRWRPPPEASHGTLRGSCGDLPGMSRAEIEAADAMR